MNPEPSLYPEDDLHAAWALTLAESEPGYRRLRASGGYRSLHSFQKSTLIYDGTVRFCNRWISLRSRTHDQMVQAARSGRQNIAEGNRAAATSSSSELHLTNVARASLEELMLDFEDYLRQHQLPEWEPNDPPALDARKRWLNIESLNPTLTALSHRKQDDARWTVYADLLESGNAEIQANTLLCLIHQTNYLLDRHISGLERDIIEQGGYREQLTAARLNARNPQPAEVPTCPECQAPMRLRSARGGPNAGGRFWGCSRFPNCRATRKHEPQAPGRFDGSDGSDGKDG